MSKVKLCDVCVKQSSKYAQKDLNDLHGEYPVFGASGFIKNISEYHQENDYVAVVKDGAGIGRTMFLPGKSSVIGTLQYLLPKKNVLPKYLYYAVRSMHLEKYYTGATIPHIYFKDYQKEEFNLPELSEQKNVVFILEKLEKVISYRKRQLESLDKLVKSRFVEMFGDVSTNNYKCEISKLRDVANIGSSHRVLITDFVEEGIPFYRGTEIGELASGVKPKEPYFISEEHYNRIANDKTKPQIGDLLLPSICNKGQVWMVDTSEPFYYKDGRVLCISPNREIFVSKYLEYYMRAKTLVEYAKLGSGSTFAEFKIFLLKDIDVLIPPRELQEQFADFAQQVDKLKFEVTRESEKVQILYDSLLQKYFNE